MKCYMILFLDEAVKERNFSLKKKSVKWQHHIFEVSMFNFSFTHPTSKWGPKISFNQTFVLTTN